MELVFLDLRVSLTLSPNKTLTKPQDPTVPNGYLQKSQRRIKSPKKTNRDFLREK